MIKIKVIKPEDHNDPIMVFLKNGITQEHQVIDGVNTFAHSVYDLQYSDKFTIGQVFGAVSRYYGKTKDNYGKRWIKLHDANHNISTEFTRMKKRIESCSNDLDRVNIVCRRLEESSFALPKGDGNV